MRVRNLGEVGAPIIHHEDLRLAIRVSTHDLVDHQSQERGLAGAGIPEQVAVRLPMQIQHHRSEGVFIDADDHPAMGETPRDVLPRHGVSERGIRQIRRQQTQFRGRPTLPGRMHLGDQIGDAVAHCSGVVPTIDTWQRGKHVQFRHAQTTARSPLGHGGGDLAIDLGITWIPEAQFKLGADQIADIGPNLQPPVGTQQHMHAEGQTACDNLLHLGFQLFIIVTEHSPAVDDQKHIAIPVIDLSRGATPTIGVHAVDAPFLEEALAGVDDAVDFGKRTAHFLLFVAGSHATDVFQGFHGGERTAAAVDDVELRLQRGMRQCQRCDDGAQHHALAAEGSAHHGHVTSRTG